MCMCVHWFLDKPPRQADFKAKRRCCMQGFSPLALVASPFCVPRDFRDYTGFRDIIALAMENQAQQAGE